MKKQEVLQALQDGRADFLKAVDGLAEADLSTPGVVEDWSIKDLLFHLTMWEAELVKLLWQASQGMTPMTIHFSQTPMDETNAAWTAQVHERSLEQIWQDFHAVRKQTSRRVAELNENDFENPDRFPWQKAHPLWIWIAEDTFKHEAEHADQIRAWRQAKGI